MKILKGFVIVVFSVCIALCVNLAVCINEDEYVKPIVAEREYEEFLEQQKAEKIKLEQEEEQRKKIEKEKARAEEERIRKAPKAYLTFDDGPSSNTDKILEILDRYDVKATFFVVAKENSDSLDDEYKKIVEHGNTIGMHSYSHVYDKIYATDESFSNDIDKIQTLVLDKTGVLSRVYRFPGGSSIKLSGGKIPRFIGMLSERGISYFDWNIDSNDATNPVPSSTEIVNNVLSKADGMDEAVILFHDLANKTTTVEALPDIIEGLESRGFVILPITEETPAVHHYEVN